MAFATVALVATACLDGSGPTLAELATHPVVAGGCPIGWEVSRSSTDRSAISGAVLELTCAADAQPERVFERVDSLVGPYDGKVSWVGPIALGAVIGGRSSRSPDLALPASYAWHPPGLQIEVHALAPGSFPVEASGARTVYRVTVQKDPFAT